MYLRRGLFGALTVSLLAGPAWAAMINWGVPTDIAGDSDVSLNGTLVAAHNFGPRDVVATTVNGVTFQPFAIIGTSNVVTQGNFTFSTPDPGDPIVPATTGTWQALSADYTALLASAARLRADRGHELLISGLTAGESYEFQVWINNSDRENGPNFLFETTVGDGLGNEVEVYAGDNGVAANGPPVPGQYVIGTFTADAGTQVVTFSNGEIDGWVNGFQLRQQGGAPPPPPQGVPDGGATLALLGLALPGLLWPQARAGRRRRRAAP